MLILIDYEDVSLIMHLYSNNFALNIEQFKFIIDVTSVF